MEDLGSAIHSLIGGRKATTFEDDGDTYDVRVRVAEDDRTASGRDRCCLPVRTAVRKARRACAISSTCEEGTGPVQIDRQDRSRQVTIMANLQRVVQAAGSRHERRQAIAGDLANLARRERVARGSPSKFTGDAEMMERIVRRYQLQPDAGRGADLHGAGRPVREPRPPLHGDVVAAAFDHRGTREPWQSPGVR